MNGHEADRDAGGPAVRAALVVQAAQDRAVAASAAVAGAVPAVAASAATATAPR